MLVMIDNYDSFVYNLVQYFGKLGEEIKIFRNDKVSIEEIETIKPDRLVISPGPRTPKEAAWGTNPSGKPLAARSSGQID